VNRQPTNVPPGGLADSSGGSPLLISAHTRRTACVAPAHRPQVRSPLRRGRRERPSAAEPLAAPKPHTVELKIPHKNPSNNAPP